MLYLDCGNTAVKCLYQADTHTFIHSEVTFNALFKDYLTTIKPSTKVIVSSVASSDVLHNIKQLLNQHFTHTPKFAHTEERFKHLKNGYQHTYQLGVDRWLAMIAMQHLTQPYIIIDAGSWIKMDVVLKGGQHQGGAIISLSETREKDIFKRFSLSPTQCSKHSNLFGTSTQQCLCMSQGKYQLDAVNALLKQWLRHLKQACHIIISGGDATLVANAIKQIDRDTQAHILDIQTIENLVLLGLSIRYPA